ncbi:Ankrd26 [Symbiodinium sp. KB8]|nr:Ankrd26 [Symbiodinium sp. KB8]
MQTLVPGASAVGQPIGASPVAAVFAQPAAAPLAADPGTSAAVAAALALLQPQPAVVGYGAVRPVVHAAPTSPYARAPPAAAVPVQPTGPIPGLDPATLAAINMALGLGGQPAPPSAPAASVLPALSNLPGLQGLDLGSLAGLANIPGLGPAPATAPDARPPRNPPGVIGRRPKAKAASTVHVPNLRDEEVANPGALLEAADARDEGRCRALVQHPSFRHINEKLKDGRTALHVAMLRKLPEDLCLAIATHKDFNETNAVDTFGYTLLILAASKGMSQVCNAVLDRDDFVGVNAQDKWGATALHWAADQDLADVCEKMLSHPEFVEGNRRAWSFAFEDKTALDVALHRNCKAAADVIRRHVGPPR